MLRVRTFRARRKFTLLCLGGRGSSCNFWEENPQVHLIIIRE